MQPKFSRRFDAIEHQRASLQNASLALDEAQLRWAPDADTWSTLQIIEHLVLSDETVGSARETATAETEAPLFRVLPRAWRRALILSALKRDFVLPLPSPDIEPGGNVPLETLLARWEDARGATRRVLEAMQSDERRYGHPVLGPLSASQMLDLSQVHTAYHARQIEKLQSSAMFPAKSSA